MAIPTELQEVASYAQRALGAIRPTDENTIVRKDFLLSAVKCVDTKDLPPHYLIYFLLVDLLGFRDLGQFEKIAWSIPVDYNGKVFLIEFRKFGVGIFVQDSIEDKEAAEEIASRLRSAVRAARRYFDWKAESAVAGGNLNVVNKSNSLFFNFQFLQKSYANKLKESESSKGFTFNGDDNLEPAVEDLMSVWANAFPGHSKNAEARALGMAAIEAFFSWTEHVFIHIAILFGKLTTGTDVAKIAKAEWSEKFRAALDVNEPDVKECFDRLMNMRKEVRNYIAHGSFGKDGEAFSFHSSAGAVPVLLPHKEGNKSFALGPGKQFNVGLALESIEQFIGVLWSGSRGPAKIYIENELPSILTFATNGRYAKAMESPDAMEALVGLLSYETDRAANMDW